MQLSGNVCATASLALISTLSLADDALSLTSPVMEDGGAMPTTFSCDGEGISPPLSWGVAPDGTESYVLIMDHDTRGGDTKWYWTLYNIPAATTAIEPDGTVGESGSNSVTRSNGYAPPCSKGPGEKIYRYHLYALSDTLTFSDATEVSAQALRTAMDGQALASDSLTVSFERDQSALPDDEHRPPPPPTGGDRNTDAPLPPPDTTSLSVPTSDASTDSEACRTIRASVSSAGFDDVVVTCDDDYAYVHSDTYPDHTLMNGIVGSNEQVPVPAVDYAAPIVLNPKKAESVTTIDAALGVAVNGVPIYDYSAQGELDVTEYDRSKDTVLLGQLDQCGGHAGRGDDYHYHAKPTCMIDAMEDFSDSSILGWGYDGYPLYGDNNPNGTAIEDGDLDLCNGQADDQFGYRYHTSDEPPYVFKCLVGEVDTQALPRVRPLEGTDTRVNLRPPHGGVDNLTFEELDDGTRLMRYDYDGEAYYMQYRASAAGDHCYDFEQKTISNGGVVETGVFCR